MKTLCFDVGNTKIDIGVFDETGLIKNSDLLILNKENIKKLGITLKKLLKKEEINDCCISSVVNSLDKKIEKTVKKFIKGNVYFVNHNLIPNKFFAVSPKAKEETGNDLLCDVIFANSLKEGPKIIVDLGTASKILYVNDKNAFYTCFIFPGFRMMLDSLSKGTFKLPKLNENFDKIKEIPGETSEVLWSSAYYSIVGTIKQIINNYKENVSKQFSLMMCGGYNDIIKKEFKPNYCDNHFTLKGCFEIYKNYILKGAK